jgi:hypothetical protein
MLALLLVCCLWILPLTGWADTPEQAPARDAEQQQCEPLRKEIIRLNQKPTWLGVFYQPRIASLKRQYARCFQAIQTQEFKYLRRAEITNHPGPKLPDAPAPKLRRVWWWPFQ